MFEHIYLWISSRSLFALCCFSLCLTTLHFHILVILWFLSLLSLSHSSIIPRTFSSSLFILGTASRISAVASRIRAGSSTLRSRHRSDGGGGGDGGSGVDGDGGDAGRSARIRKAGPQHKRRSSVVFCTSCTLHRSSTLLCIPSLSLLLLLCFSVFPLFVSRCRCSSRCRSTREEQQQKMRWDSKCETEIRE